MSGAIATRRSELMQCPFDPVTMGEALSRVVGWCLDGRGSRTVVTMNAALLVTMRRDPELARACRAGDLVVADGVPVVWASRLAGAALPERVNGCDMMERLLEVAAARRLPVFFLGARPEVVRALVAVCARRYPGLPVAGARDGYFRPEQEAEVVDQIRRSGAAILFVGMPSPFKETFLERNRAALGVPVLMGVGGSFDVAAGFVRRAPLWMQSAGLEWLWRFLMEPRRMWRRYLVTNTLFLARLAVEVATRPVRS
jgi:N-acetylglucosaminyldiphosphoundecaprenol N-acetyl-beta-D-mannosaminyltransferase